jgi:hypothetical protein
MVSADEPLRQAMLRTLVGPSSITDKLNTSATRSKWPNCADNAPRPLSGNASGQETTAAEFRPMLARPSFKSQMMASITLPCLPESREPSIRSPAPGAVMSNRSAQPPCSPDPGSRVATTPNRARHTSWAPLVDHPVRLRGPPLSAGHHDASPFYLGHSSEPTSRNRRYHSMPISKPRSHAKHASAPTGGVLSLYTIARFPSIVESHHTPSSSSAFSRGEMAWQYPPSSPSRVSASRYRPPEEAPAVYLSPPSTLIHNLGLGAPNPTLLQVPALLSPIGPSTLDGLNGSAKDVRCKRHHDTFSHSAFLYGFCE